MNKKSSNSNLLIVGSVAFDSIKTPFGQGQSLLGGSASYFCLSAVNFLPPSLVAVVGSDFTPANKNIFTKRKIDISGLETVKGKSFSWGGEYSFDLNSRTTTFTELNVFQNFKPKLSLAHKKSDYAFLGNIHPKLQLEVLEQMESPKFVGLDTMNYWMTSALPDLKKVLKKVNVFVINDSEGRELSGEHNILKAAKKIAAMMQPKSYLIIKRGEYGLLMFNKNKIFHLPGFPLEDVIDPTGAGDSFAGGFMGYLAKTGDISWENLKKACVAGSVLASFCVEKLGTIRLQNLNKKDIETRIKDFKSLTHFEA